LKLYLTSFRNHTGFHEDVVNVILKDLDKLLTPKYIEILGLFNPRGGIAIYPFANISNDKKYKDFALMRKSEIFSDND
jgi:7-cyano-7-deazaguanine reductase